MLVLMCWHVSTAPKNWTIFPVWLVELEEDECISDFDSSLLGPLFSVVKFSVQIHSFPAICCFPLIILFHVNVYQKAILNFQWKLIKTQSWKDNTLEGQCPDLLPSALLEGAAMNCKHHVTFRLKVLKQLKSPNCATPTKVGWFIDAQILAQKFLWNQIYQISSTKGILQQFHVRYFGFCVWEQVFLLNNYGHVYKDRHRQIQASSVKLPNWLE